MHDVSVVAGGHRNTLSSSAGTIAGPHLSPRYRGDLMTPEQTAEVRRRIEETLRQAAADGLISGDDGAAGVVTGWHLVFESAAAESRWLLMVGDGHSFPWQWRGWLHEVLHRT